MTDILDSLGDAVGGAVNFLTPTTDRRNAGWGIGDLINTLGDVGRNSVVGGISALDDVVMGDGSGASKLFMAGLVGLGVGGAAFGARQLAAQQKLERQLAAPSLARWSPTAGRLGLRPRFNPTTFEGDAVVRQHPGIRPKTADVLGATDYVATATHLLHDFARKDPSKVGRAAAIVQTYADSLGDIDPAGRLGAAQLDFAKVDTAFDSKVLKVSQTVAKGEGYLNGRFAELWEKYRAGDLTDDLEAEELVGFVRTIGDATRHITEPDLSFDLVGYVEQIDLTPNGAVVRTYVPDWADDQVFHNPEMRSLRIRSLNLRPIAARGKEFMQRLYRLGIKEQEVPGTLPRPLEKGSGWYPKASIEIDEALPALADVPWANKRSLTAAVSLTSEAEKWEGNVRLAASVMRTANTPEVLDPDFQAWLRDGTFEDAVAGTGKRTYEGKAAKAHERTFQRLHDAAKRGNQLSARDFKKVLRLAAEDPEDLFRSTSGRKQKNFYLNLIDPSDPVPITIDRHMHDIFLGLASSSDFKLLEGNDIGDSNYELIGDVLREAAGELGVTPNELQGVAWEAWKALKEAHKASASDPWRAANPFRLPEADGSENRVFLALQGKTGPNLSSALENVSDTVPLVLGGSGHGLYTNPDGSLGVLARPTGHMAEQFRHLYPALLRDDGVAMWGKGAPRRVLDLEAHRAGLDRTMVGHRTETWAAGAWDELGGHPAVLAQNTIMLDIADGDLPKGIARYGKLYDPQMPTLTSAPVRQRQRLSLRDLDPDQFVDRTNSPLRTHDYATISGFIDDEQAARFGLVGYDNEVRHRQLGQRLRRMGYRPIEQNGVYDGGSEKSYLVFGISPEDAIKVGDEFHQDSVMTNTHMWYTSKAKDPANAGLAQAFDEDGLNLRVPDDAYFRSITRIGGREVKWASGYTGDEPIERIDPAGVWAERRQRRARRVAITVPPAEAHRIAEIAEELEQQGARTHAIYSQGAAPEGWATVREHLYEDPAGLTVVRSADPEFESSHGFNAWVRKADAEGLPTSNPEGRRLRRDVQTASLPNGDRLINGAVVVRGEGDVMKAPGFTVSLEGVPTVTLYKDSFELATAQESGNLVVSRSGKQFTFGADPADLVPAARIAELMGQMGIEPSSLRINAVNTTVRTANVDPPRQKGWATTVMGDRVPALRRTAAPIPEWVDRYGIDFDPAWREGDTIARLPADYNEAFKSTMDRFMADHYDLAQLVQFNRIGVQKLPADELAHYELGGGGAIVLNADFWGNPSKMRLERKWQVANNHTSPMLGEGPEAILQHELGHVVHEGLRQSFRTVAEAKAFDKDVLDRVRKQLKKGGVRVQLSEYADTNVSEFVAEAVAEAMFALHPRRVAREVYDMVMRQYRTNTTYRRSVGWAESA